MCNAVRDNPERAEFVGYDPQRVRFIVFSVAAMFAGLAGGLHAINYEIVAAEAVGAARSGTVLLMAYIGGVAHFFGAVLGAITITWLQVSLSDYTTAWQLYLGLFFMAIVLFAPGGLVRPAPDARADRADARLPRRAEDVCVAALPALAAAIGADRAARDQLSPVDPARCRRADAALLARPRHRDAVAVARGARAARRRCLLLPSLPASGRSRLAAGERRGARRQRHAAGTDVMNGTGADRRCALQLQDLHKRFGATPIIRGVSLDIAKASGTRSSAPTARASPRCSI